jgi:hypothetical protein
MIINWGALVLVACATVVAAISIVGLFSLGVAALTAGTDKAVAAGDAAVPTRTTSRLNPLTVAGYACLGTAGLFALYGLYLIIPQFH